MSWPPPGTGTFPRANATTMERSYMLEKPNAAGTTDVTGPYMATIVPETQNVSIERGGQLIAVTNRIKMPLESRATARCIVTDVVANVAYEVLQARYFLTFIECSVSRAQGDV